MTLSETIELISKAMEGVKNSQWFMSPWHVEEDASAVRNQSDGSYICNASSDSFAAYLAACSPDRMREVLAAAREAEALKWDRKREAQLATDMASDCLDEQKRREAAEARVATLERALQFVALWAWREDPPNANSKLTDAERLSVIKHHPTVKSFYETGARALLSKESADAAGSAITTSGTGGGE